MSLHSLTPRAHADDGREANVASLLRIHAKNAPERPALIARTYVGQKLQSVTFEELDRESDYLAALLQRRGIRPGMLTLMMVPPGVEFVALWFALLKLGAVTVLLDPGMGGRKLFKCLRTVEPEAFIGIPPALVLRHIAPRAFSKLQLTIPVGGKHGEELLYTAKRPTDTEETFPLAQVELKDVAGILFTTGSTGVPKGVVATHQTLHAHVSSLKAHFQITEDDCGFPAFLPFALYCIAMGTTAVMPDINPRRPADADPEKMVALLKEHRSSYSFGSPAFWAPVGRYCLEQKITLPELTRVIMFGAPVGEDVHAALSKVLTAGETFTPYGATEALPITSISGSEILSETASLTRAGKGVCVGRPLENVELQIIGISEQPIPSLSEARKLPMGEIGEVIVAGAQVTESYFNLPEHTKRGKIQDGERVWHRMGDVGYLDQAGRLWFCGRMNHRVTTSESTIFSVPWEEILNQDREINRSALVGIGKRGEQTPVFCIEADFSREKRAAKRQELRKMLAAHEDFMADTPIFFRRKLPVDFRHNAKIIREELSLWAERRMKLHRLLQRLGPWGKQLAERL